MEHLNWELSVLSRAVAYSNLSGAASHIGLSQPQLSRIVAKLEKDLALSILDRDAKRKSSWTPHAFRLAEIYTKTVQRFRFDVNALNAAAEPTTIHVGTLEGLMDLSLKFCNELFEKTSAHTIELIVADLDGLEERYFKGDLEFLLTFREPGRKKPNHSKMIGYQSLEKHGTVDGVITVSAFEFATQYAGAKRKPKERLFVSNSLVAREQWIHKFKGHGIMPSTIRAESRRKANEVPVILLAPDHLSEKLWNTAIQWQSRLRF